ncbi:hypothetical protein BJV78DRAFT_1231294 [Lactifluus subvellereus]|nr:hypothetical protein BJV78DRAFT_1231294 [Lactifluus subvellereus]
MRKGKKRALEKDEDEYKSAHVRFKNPFHTTRTYTVTLTSASDDSSQVNTVQKTCTIAYNPPTRPVLVIPPQPLNTPDLCDSVSPDSKTKTQSSVPLDQFGAHFDEIQDSSLAVEYDDTVGSACSCGVVSQMWTCRCLDCFQSPITCEQCFVQRHQTQPCHWVEQWNGTSFIRCDISALGHAITLGHRGELCHNISKKTPPLDFLIIHTNGIHRTKLLFCGCVGCGNRMQQLLKAQLFPATTEQPTTAFIFGDLQSQLFRIAQIWKVVTKP